MSYEKMDAMVMGNELKALRESNGETVMELAQAINTSTSAICMYESGKRIPRDEIKIRIAEHYSKSVESIFFKTKQHETCCEEKGA